MSQHNRWDSLKPKKRTKFRILLGKHYFIIKKHLWWIFSSKKFARKYDEIHLDHLYFSHKTQLFRPLKKVDEYLQYNKVKNLQIALEKLDQVIIHPGETFSYWKLIGKPTARKGYVNGMVLNSGTILPGIGGGLCQLSNLIYWITIHTPLTVIERYRHSFDVFPDVNRTQPFGSGATCVYNYRDLIIENYTEEPFQLRLELTSKDLIGSWTTSRAPIYYYEVYEKDHHVDHEYWGGYSRHNVLYRKKYNREGTLLEDEYLIENHALMMYSPFIEG